MTEAEAEAKRAYEQARVAKDQLKKEIMEGYRSRSETVKKLDMLWNHVNDFIPRHWRQD